jgi:hypothetical protein
MQSLAEYLFRAQRRGEIRFLLIGGRSLEAHGFVRNTKDIDFLIATGDIPSMAALLGKVGYQKQVETSIFSRWKHSSMEAEDVDLMYVTTETFDALAADAIEWKIGSAMLRVPSVQGLTALKLHAIKNNPDRTHKDGHDILMLQKCHPAELTDDDLRLLCDKYGTQDLFPHLKSKEP